MPEPGDIEYSQTLELDLGDIQPSVAGPKRPQDRLELPELKQKFRELFSKPIAESGYNKPADEIGKRFAIAAACPPTTVAGGGEQAPETIPTRAPGQPSPNQSAKNTSAHTELEMMNNRPTPDRVEKAPESSLAREVHDIGHGDVLIAAITSCTNTSNPSVMLAAGLLAKKAVERGLRVKPTVKRSLAPGSRVVTEYLRNSGLQPYLDQLGFNVVGYGCTTCIGNSGPLDPAIEDVVTGNDVIAASVLSGNRNFEARVHQSIKANFLMSPPLVVAFALAGRVDLDLSREPIGKGRDGKEVYLKEIWPSLSELRSLMQSSFSADTFKKLYANFQKQNPLWDKVPSSTGVLYEWEPGSTYIQEPPFFENFSMKPAALKSITSARALAIFGDSVTTDHISPAGSIKATSPAGVYLIQQGIPVEDFNSYGARRGNDRVMVRGTFANVRIKNLMVPGVEGGVTMHQPDNVRMSIYEAAMKYKEDNVNLIVLAGQEYGTGSSRDWAAKGTALLGVRAVIAQSFERIHRSNLVGMGVFPLQFEEGTSAQTLGLDGTESFDLVGLSETMKPQQSLTLRIKRTDRSTRDVPVRSRIDTPIEVEYYKHGGILPYVLRQLLTQA